jgi:predicted metal-binding protein
MLIKSLETYLTLARERGALFAQPMPASSVITAAWVRFKCQFGCDNYGAGLLCPPRTPTPAETQAVLDCYSRAIAFAWEAPPELKARRAARKRMHKAMFELERRAFLDGYYKALAFVAGPCYLCTDCDITQPCKYPGEPRPAMEACGMDVFATMANAGFKLEVRTCEDQGHYQCGLLLLD